MSYLRALKLRKRKLVRAIVTILIVGLIYILYQIYNIEKIYNRNNESYDPLMRGVHLVHKYKYLPDINGMFTCLKTYQVIKYEYVNDDYCDCDDGTDEPGTSACPDGVFYCKSLAYSREDPIPSSKVNDGICDCCDGSDEWNSVSLFTTLNSFHSHHKIRGPEHFCNYTCR